MAIECDEGIFSAKGCQRIVGVTPLFADVQDRTPERYLAYPRHAECVAWIHDFYPTRAWLAIDDKPYIFQPFCANLILTNGSIGLTNEIAEAVIRKVSLD